MTVPQSPEEERTEPYLEIYARREGEDRLVTSIEVLSLTNKTLGSEGRQKYLEKQQEILSGQVNLVEIDLLRGGAHSSAVPLWLAREKAGPFDYHVSVRRFDRPGEFLVYPIPLQRRLPTIRIPLLPGDPSIPISLQTVFQRLRRGPLSPRGTVRRRPDRSSINHRSSRLGSRVGKGRPAGSSELRVSPSPSKIPYGGFSPVRLQMDRQWRPSTLPQGLSAVHIRPMTPSYTPPQFSLPGIRDPRRDYPF